MTPEEKARQLIDTRLEQSGWIVQDLCNVNPMASLGVAVREYPTSTRPVDYALFVGGKPVGVIEAKKDELGENITVVEGQSGRYANSTFRYVTMDYKIRFAYEATGQLTRFTDYQDINTVLVPSSPFIGRKRFRHLALIEEVEKDVRYEPDNPTYIRNTVDSREMYGMAFGLL